MTDTVDRFPPIQPLEQLPYMRHIDGGMEPVREELIGQAFDSILEFLNDLPDLSTVPADAKEYLARRFAVYGQRRSEEGTQVGFEFRCDIDEAQRREDHRFKRNMIEAVAGR